ncbi:MAG: hypothetical protein ACM31G_06990 [Flavobacteriales bacterium]
MESKEVILIVKATVNPDEMESFNAYIDRLTELFAKVKAESIGHFLIKETLVGNELPSFIGIYKFKSKKTLNAVYGTTEYINKMIPLRNKGFKRLEVYLS